MLTFARIQLAAMLRWFADMLDPPAADGADAGAQGAGGTGPYRPK